MFFAFRLVVTLLILSCLSPEPEFPAGRSSAFASMRVDAQPRIVIWKSHYTLTLYKGNLPYKTYRAVFGDGFSDGDKRVMGDNRTPEGDFYICTMSPSRRFYKFMGLSYPAIKHAEYGLQNNIISPQEYFMIKKALDGRQTPPWDTKLGGAVGIHGRTLARKVAEQSSSSRLNWTEGCIALDNSDVDEIYRMVSIGTPVTILP